MQIALSASRQQTMLPATITGKVTKIGYYFDALPKLIIAFRKEDAGLLPYRTGERVVIPLAIDGERFKAGIRTTARSATVMLCPDLVDATGDTVRLIDVLFSQGRTQPKVNIVVEKDSYTVV
jgi:hypothetical protein